MTQLCRFVVVMVLAMSMTGCFTVTASSSFTQKELTKSANVALATSTTRAEVHRSLGEPWISSERWRVEVYRKTGTYRDVLITLGLLPFPLPAPIPTLKKDLTGYTLVSYSDAGVVEGVDTAISKYPDSPLADIQAGDFAFREENPPPGAPTGSTVQALIVSHERFASKIKIDVKSCTVLVVCSHLCRTSGERIEMQLDDDTSTRYVFGILGAHPLVPMNPTPGAHTLHFSVQGRADWGELVTQFTCPSSELQYVSPMPLIRRTRPIGNLFRPLSRLQGTVEIQSVVPDELKHFGVLLWTDGRWLVDRGEGAL